MALLAVSLAEPQVLRGGTVVAPGVGTVGGGVSGADVGAGIGVGLGAGLGGYIGNEVGDTLGNIVQMAKGGTQNKSNEYSRAATAEAQATGKDPCDILDDWYREARAAGDAIEAQKIVQAQKALGCRNKRKRCP